MIRVAVMQTAGQGSDRAANLASLAASVRSAQDAGARLLVTPEMFLTGYAIGAGSIRTLAEPAGGAALQQVAAIARESGVGIVLGYPERDQQGQIFNAAAYVDPEHGVIANHRKSHLFGPIDNEVFTAGDGTPAVFTIGPFKAALLVCYDVEFPENVRQLALEGVDLLIVPTALMAPYSFVARMMVATRAYENQIYLIYANRCGSEHDFHYYGESAVIGPDGLDLARAATGETLLVADLDVALMAQSRALNTYLRDRRPTLYGRLSAPIHTG